MQLQSSSASSLRDFFGSACLRYNRLDVLCTALGCRLAHSSLRQEEAVSLPSLKKEGQWNPEELQRGGRAAGLPDGSLNPPLPGEGRERGDGEAIHFFLPTLAALRTLLNRTSPQSVYMFAVEESPLSQRRSTASLMRASAV